MVSMTSFMSKIERGIGNRKMNERKKKQESVRALFQISLLSFENGLCWLARCKRLERVNSALAYPAFASKSAVTHSTSRGIPLLGAKSLIEFATNFPSDCAMSVCIESAKPPEAIPFSFFECSNSPLLALGAPFHPSIPSRPTSFKGARIARGFTIGQRLES